MDKVITTINDNKLFKPTDPLLLMVSGGSDSVALTYLMKVLHNGPITIMHLNHKLRVPDCDEDAKFVEDLAHHLSIKIYSYSKNITKLAGKNNIEAFSRQIRYKLAKDLIDKPNSKIVTAHTADDRIENFYMRSIVGTGPGGLASLKYKNHNIVRPLLDCTKEELKQYIQNISNPYKDNKGNLWREDKTNTDTDRFRAYVRHKIIPKVKSKNSNLVNNLTNTMNLIADEDRYMKETALSVSQKYITYKNNSCVIAPELINEDIVIQRRVIYNVLKNLFDEDERINTSSISSIITALNTHNYTDNIQNNYAVHSNKRGVLIEPMKEYRAKRNRN